MVLENAPLSVVALAWFVIIFAGLVAGLMIKAFVNTNFPPSSPEMAVNVSGMVAIFFEVEILPCVADAEDFFVTACLIIGAFFGFVLADLARFRKRKKGVRFGK